jgi:uncharacterized membrane protein
MKNLQTGVLVVAAVTTGLMAGLFTAFTYSVMPGLRRSSDHTFVEAMQGINKAIVNPVFMLPFMGTIPLLGLAVFLAWRGDDHRSVLPWLIAALVLYLVGFMVTVGVNVPLNDELARAGDPDRIARLTKVRAEFEDKWVLWNIVRALLHTAAFACLAWALVVHGGHRLHEGGKADAFAPTVAPASAGAHAQPVGQPQLLRDRS